MPSIPAQSALSLAMRQRQQDLSAQKGVEVTLQSNDMIHINVDGVCALRIKMGEGTVFRLDVVSEEFEYEVSY